MLNRVFLYLPLVAGLLLASLLQPLPLAAQPAAESAAQPAAEREGAAEVPESAVDESAMRYYARNRDLERLEAEIRRLHAEHPTWQPPEDLFDPQAAAGFDEGPLWQLFAEGRYAEVREGIVELEQETPGWQASDELLRQLDLAEDHQRLQAAAELGQWQRVIDIAQAQPALSSCERVDNSWFIAEAYVRTEQPDAGAEVYRGILEHCEEEAMLIATLQKASELLDDQRVLVLDRLLEERVGDSEEALAARTALLEGRLVERLSGEERLAPELLASLEEQARAARDGEAALNLGWYHAGQRQWEEAETWFRTATEWGAGNSAIEGRILALMRLGRTGTAEQLAAQHAASSPGIYRSYIGLLTERLGGRGRSVDMKVAGRLAAYADRHRDANIAQALGWAALETEDLEAAEAWFRQSLAWRENENAAVGLAVVLQRQGNVAAFDELAAVWAGRSARIREMQASGGGTSAAALALERGELPRCLRLTEGQGLSAGDREIRGWCLLEAERTGEAMEVFRGLLQDPASGAQQAQAAQGYLFSLLQRGLVEEALHEMHRLPLPPEERNELLAQGLAEKAMAANANGNYRYALRLIEAHARLKPLSYDVAIVRGWAYYNSGQYQRARETFLTLDRQYSTRDTRLGLQLLRQRELK